MLCSDSCCRGHFHRAKTANDGEAPSSKPKPKRKSPVKKVKKGTATAEEPSGAAVLTEASVEHGTAKKYVARLLVLRGRGTSFTSTSSLLAVSQLTHFCLFLLLPCIEPCLRMKANR